MNLREGYTAWRRLGPVEGTRRAARVGAEVARAPARRVRVRLAPLRASRTEVEAALGGVPVEAALRGLVRDALPTVARWQPDASVVGRAEDVLAHRFDLLGSGPVELGPEIDWSRDFKTGVRWPARHISRVPTVMAPGADIKVPWELSRCQHLPLLAAAAGVTGDPRFADELGAQLRSFIAANPVEVGACWACTMDVAIRAANWIAALALRPAAATDEVVGALLLHGRFIRSHLEWGDVRGNHYLSDVVGLLAVAALFARGEGAEWARWATAELESEMRHQVREDGCDHEMSVPYHRLVTELFVCGTQAADALCPGALSDGYRERLERMLAFARDHTRPDGLAPQFGDADSGRYLPLDDYARLDPRDHRHLFRQAGRPFVAATTHAAYPDGGWYVMRHDDLWAMARCGDVGLGGGGGHAHNDQLAFELCLGEQPLVVDPGAYLYTPDPAARNAFRSTAAHSTLQVAGREQNPLRSDYLFAVEDRARARALAWEADGPRARFAGRHDGFAPAVHERAFAFDGEARTLTITDVVRGAAAGDELAWALPLAPGAEVDGGVARWPSARLEVRSPGLEWTVEEGWVSPAYGVRERAPVLRARRAAAGAEDRQTVELRCTAG